MSRYFTLNQLAEGIKQKHVGAERARLIEKWARTGLLRGLDGRKRENMAQLLENQAGQVLLESNALSTGGGGLTSSGQIQGFSNIAFPIVRRVFGGLVANELVSIQPMSLPSGLIFYIDYTYGSNVGGTAGIGLSNTATADTYARGQSLYNNPTGKGIQSGSLATGGQYDLVGTGYTKLHTGSTLISVNANAIGAWSGASDTFVSGTTVAALTDFSGSNARFANYDPQLQTDLSLNTLDYCFAHFSVANIVSALPTANVADVDQFAVTGFTTAGSSQAWGEAYQAGTGVLNLRRLNKRGDFSGGVFTPNPLNGTHIQTVIRLSAAGGKPGPSTTGTENTTCSITVADVVKAGDSVGATLTIPSFESDFGSTPSPAIPDIDIKIETISITATTRKLRARWTPELAQDLNAYHSTDAEVELTSILSEQIALEIDREILNELLLEANGANYYWSRAPGRFVDKTTGAPIQLANALSIGPAFTGTVQDWYQTLVETVIDVANTIHRKTLRGAANFCVTGPDVATIFEASILYKPKYTIDGEGQIASPFTVGAEAVGTLSNRFTVYKDPYFPRNRILVGFKGGSYLETGFVYAPYVPLIVTPTIYAPEDFTPRKGVMTRYGKKMVRSDFYGTVTILDMNVI
jgi:hypothetical protein